MLDRQCIRNEILGNTVYRNGGDGLSFYESGNNLIFENTILANGAHGIRLRNSRKVLMINNNIIGNKSYGVYLHTRNLSDITRNISLDPYEQAVSGFLYGGTVSYNTSGSLYLSDYDEFTVYDVYIENKDSQKLRLGGDLKRYHNQVASSLSGGNHAVSLYKESE
jgi:parallel beta-helix repeat protein